MKSNLLKVLFFLAHVAILAQSPVVKIDLNMSGRTEAETNDPNYVAWIPDNATSTSKTESGVTFKFSKAGSNGTALRPNWYKAGVAAPNYARLICDGMYVDGGNSGAQIDLTISGLSAGTHSFMAFHNALDDPATYDFAPIDVYVNNSKVVSNVVMSERAITTDAVQSSYVTFTVSAGQSVTISYRAQTSGSQSMKNVYINGFELNTPNVKSQAKNPSPADGDLHFNADNGSANLTWVAGASATAHRVYFGKDEASVTNATTSSATYKGQQTATSYAVSGLYALDTYYWRIDEVTAAGVVTKGNTWMFRKRQLAFPGAEGYGRFAIGGRGGKVIHVTNLNDTGAGSLRDAVENYDGPRTIVFDVSGVIALESRIICSDQFITIAGQTAPGKGICIRKAPFGCTGNDLIGRHLKVRLGGGATYDGMGLTGANHSILDHCSISWTIDESFSSRGGKNITLQRTLISEALNAAGHQNYPAGTEHGYAGTIGGDVGSFHHNLLAHNYGRNWSMGGGLDGNGYLAGRLDITNNVVYNWGGRTTDGGAMEVNFVGNYYKPGAGSKKFVTLTIDHEGIGLGTQRAYFSGNVMPGYFDESNQSAGRTETYSNGDYKKYEGFVSSPFFPSYVTVQSATDAYKSVLSDVGQTQPVFDDHDIRIVDETLNGTYKYKGSVTGKPGFPDNESDVGGYENYPALTRASNWDSDKDGLPDFWETATGSSNSTASGNFADANADPDKNGYTELEEYLNWMAEPHYFVTTGSQTIDLKAMFVGYSKTTPTYSFSSVVNGTVAISGSTATFTASKCGFASFNLTVKDAAGATMTKTIGVFVSGTCSSVANVKPTVSITAPTNNAKVAAQSNVTLTATATDSDGTITKVEFYNGTTLLGTSTTSPYSFTWTNVVAGTYTITAVATDNSGATTTSSAITLVAVVTDCNGTPNGTATLDNCGRCVGGTTTKTACSSASELETEACSYDGVVESSNAGFKGTGYINVPNAIGSQISFNVNATTAGTYTLSFRYASGGTADRNAKILINGVSQNAAFAFPATGAFTAYGTVEVSLDLNAGNNSVQLVANTADGLVNLDQIGYVSSGVSKGNCVITSLESEDAQEISIYPNPSKSQFEINCKSPKTIQLTDVQGKLLHTFSEVNKISIGDNLGTGIYLLKIDHKMYKLIKE